MRTSRSTESENFTKSDFNRMILEPPAMSNKDHVLAQWVRLVEEYSRKHITYRTDVLPAFSAIAKSFHISAEAIVGAYYAGIWENSLPASLCWRRDHYKLAARGCYCAPTWSWASVQVPVLWRKGGARTGHSKYDAKVLDADCTPEASDRFGRISSGFIELEAAALPSKVVDVRIVSRIDDYTVYETGFEPESIRLERWDIAFQESIDTEDDRVGLEGQTIWIACIKRAVRDGLYTPHSLLLRRNSDDTFRRIGILDKDDNLKTSLFTDVEAAARRTFRIV